MKTVRLAVVVVAAVVVAVPTVVVAVEAAVTVVAAAAVVVIVAAAAVAVIAAAAAVAVIVADATKLPNRKIKLKRPDESQGVLFWIGEGELGKNLLGSNAAFDCGTRGPSSRA